MPPTPPPVPRCLEPPPAHWAALECWDDMSGSFVKGKKGNGKGKEPGKGKGKEPGKGKGKWSDAAPTIPKNKGKGKGLEPDMGKGKSKGKGKGKKGAQPAAHFPLTRRRNIFGPFCFCRGAQRGPELKHAAGNGNAS